MKKLSEMTTTEFGTCVAKIAECAERLFSDGAVCEALDTLAQKMGDKTRVDRAVALFTAELFPLLTGEKHKADTYTIMEALGCGKAEEMGDKNGIEMLRDLFCVFVRDGEVAAIFRPGAEVRGE